jgi:hypothetical protein
VHTKRTLQLIVLTLNYHGPFTVEARERTDAHPAIAGECGRVGSYRIYLPPFQKFIQYTPNSNLVVPRGVVHVTLRSLVVAYPVNRPLDILLLSDPGRGRSGGGSVCGNSC